MSSKPKRCGLARRSAKIIAGACLAGFLTGCTVVKPWQRETLADATMQPDRNPMAAGLLEHVYFSREAANGGRTVGGGGCGCN